MPISKGEPWGEPGRLPDDAPVVSSDHELRALWEPAFLAGDELPIAGLTGGDLARTCGATGDTARLRGPDAQRLPVDVVEVRIGSGRHLAVSHVLLRRGWWRGRIVAAMNAQFVGDWDVAPRGHPNDGRVDLFDADLSVGDRWKARQRLPGGAHVPHPDIAQRRVRDVELDLGRPLDVWIDGVRVGRADHVELTVHPDAGTVVV